MKKKAIPLSLIKILNTLIVEIPFLLCWFLYYEQLTFTATSRQVSALVLIIYTIVFYSLCLSLDGFRASILKVSDQIYSQVIAVALSDAFIAIIIWIMSPTWSSL